ncbi:dihydrofolate reductase [Stackebrandtia albiflava]|uniref:Dihydrofolate reductase n=1 Tax=Stackebrandtia albiflava TaxID=406432 RepID=A0A562V2X5_9ACTN|nr:dihydrofolate reductase family protein [Stackebrandtia albiflava]TWJ12234.1 dihydrofolate reductase [Stackebrandtia albiflava]
MSKVISGISMSLDGFVTGPNVTRETQLGDGGEVLHRWLEHPDPEDAALLAGMGGGAGAVLMGRRSYDLAEGDGGWGDGGPVGPVPCFVVTHTAPDPATVRAPSVFTFVTGGLHEAVARAKAVAGGKVVAVHGASVARQCLAAGLLDEIQIHLAPVILGDGTRLLEHLGGPIPLERTQVVATRNATHLRFTVLGPRGDARP